MTITVNIGDVDLPELLAKVEAGEDVILTRNGVPVASVAPIAPDKNTEHQKVIEEIRAFRARMPSITQEEIAEWKAIGRK